MDPVLDWNTNIRAQHNAVIKIKIMIYMESMRKKYRKKPKSMRIEMINKNNGCNNKNIIILAKEMRKNRY